MSEVELDRRDVEPPPAVPAPVPPDDPAAWYAPEVRDQRVVHPGVVATVTEPEPGTFHYDVREPPLSATDADTLERVREHFHGATLDRPRTREGTVERAATGFEGKYDRIVSALLDGTPAARRRVRYHALCELRLLGDLTPLALDPEIEVADVTGEALRVHTTDFAPARTDLDADADYLDRFLSERIERHEVAFREFSIPVVVYRERLLGADAFDTKYAVLEPGLLDGDRELIEACKERIWETNVEGVIGDGRAPETRADAATDRRARDGGEDGRGDVGDGPGDAGAVLDDQAAFVADRARRFLSRQLAAREASAWPDLLAFRVRELLAEYGVGVEPVDDRFSEDRLDDLAYYVLRDFVGDDKLTVPIRDDYLEDVEANRVGERVKVVPRRRLHDERIPTNLVFESESRFVNLVTQLAARDGVELNASNPSAKVNLGPREVPEGTTIRCALALPVISEDGPHVSIRKQLPEAMTPVDLIERGSISPEVVALLWLCYEHHGVVLFSGPTGVGKTTLMNAHMPFVPYHDRPISIDEGSREVRLPQETGVSLTTRDHATEFKRVTMADLMTECNYLNPDVEVIAEINTPASFRTFAETLNTGHGVVGTTHAETVETLVNRVVEQGLPAYLLREIDLVVFPRHVDGERYVGEVVELLDAHEAEQVGGAGGHLEKGDATVHWNRVAWRDHGGEFHLAYDHPDLGGSAGGGASGAGTDDGERRSNIRFFHRIAELTDRPVEAVEAEFHRKVGYVEYFRREGVSDFQEFFSLLSELRNDEAATVERLERERG